jgi:rSAM/selenodomain-associated transferase 2
MTWTEDANSPSRGPLVAAIARSTALGLDGRLLRSLGVSQRLAIVVPTLDEEPGLEAHLPSALAAGDQVVVSDGGSTDRTREAAAALGATVVSGPAGRGTQLNRGAAACDAELLLFLHADTTLPAGAAAAVRDAVASGHDGGGFRVRFAPSSPAFRLGSAIVNVRTRMTRLPLGDQAQFVTRQAFHRLGGYREWPVLEDLDFALRLRRDGRPVVLPLAVTTSSRRYLRGGIARTIVTNWLMWVLFAAGVPPHRLGRLYGQVR